MQGHLEIVRVYKEVPARLLTVPFPNATYPGPGAQPTNGVEPPPLPAAGAATEDRFAENRKIFLFRIMDTPGLSLIHEQSFEETSS